LRKKILCIFGTRPEAIKFAPLVKALYARKEFETKIVVTGQHREMLDQVLSFFNIKPDYDLNLMKKNQTLFDITADSLKGLEQILEVAQPDLIFVQGDTTTAFVGALAGYYKKIQIAHLEAGLRSHDKFAPYPEEINRTLISPLTDYHFAPTWKSKENLVKESITENVFVVGNTVIDALYLGLEIIENTHEKTFLKQFSFIDFKKKIILITGHRRENLGESFENMCFAMRDIVKQNPDVELIYPMHLNPKVREPVLRLLKNHDRIHLIEPLEYPEMIWMMKQSYLVLTDSGGVQEEAPALGKPVLVMRDVTERQEGVDAGTAKLVGTNYDVILATTNQLIHNQGAYNKMAQSINPYGDGKTSQKIIELLLKEVS